MAGRRNPAPNRWYVLTERDDDTQAHGPYPKAQAEIKAKMLAQGGFDRIGLREGDRGPIRYVRGGSQRTVHVRRRNSGRASARRNGATLDQPGYPFARMEERYAGYSEAQLRYALKDAKEAHKNAEDMLRAYGDAQASASAGWYADDVHTIAAELRRRTKKNPKRGTVRRNHHLKPGQRAMWAPRGFRPAVVHVIEALPRDEYDVQTADGTMLRLPGAELRAEWKRPAARTNGRGHAKRGRGRKGAGEAADEFQVVPGGSISAVRVLRESKKHGLLGAWARDIKRRIPGAKAQGRSVARVAAPGLATSEAIADHEMRRRNSGKRKRTFYTVTRVRAEDGKLHPWKTGPWGSERAARAVVAKGPPVWGLSLDPMERVHIIEGTDAEALALWRSLIPRTNGRGRADRRGRGR